jgi:hypothetical protein
MPDTSTTQPLPKSPTTPQAPRQRHIQHFTLRKIQPQQRKRHGKKYRNQCPHKPRPKPPKIPQSPLSTFDPLQRDKHRRNRNPVPRMKNKDRPLQLQPRLTRDSHSLYRDFSTTRKFHHVYRVLQPDPIITKITQKYRSKFHPGHARLGNLPRMLHLFFDWQDLANMILSKKRSISWKVSKAKMAVVADGISPCGRNDRKKVGVTGVLCVVILLCLRVVLRGR